MRGKNTLENKFINDVYFYCSKIPRGKISTYGEIARAMGTKAYRQVGQALKRNPYAPKVPCHRVVKSSGDIGGFSGSDLKNIKKKISILKEEGVDVKNGKIVDFEKRLFRIS